MKTPKRCIGGFPDACKNLAGPRNPVWCDSCDQRRMEHISNQLNVIAAALAERSEA